MSAGRVVRLTVPSYGLTPDAALAMMLRRLESSGALLAWPLYCLDKPDTTPPMLRATLRGAFRKDR